MNLSGRCLCGAIEYTVTHQPVQVLNCHCTLCRRMNGSAFSTYVVVRASDLRFLRGEEALIQYAVTERTTRHCCRHCGCALFNANPASYPGLRMLYLGTLDEAAYLAPRVDIYCDAKLAWVDSAAALPAFAGPPVRTGGGTAPVA